MAFDAFLKIDGIDGESTDAKHKGEIEVLSFSWGTAQPGLANGQPNSRNAKLKITDLSFIKRVDVATPALMQEAAVGGAFPTATLVARKNSGDTKHEFLKITMSDVIITSVSAAGNTATDPLPLEQISFNFQKINLSVVADSDSDSSSE
jgi:type VI secretion system secreted protein Hcp